MRKIKNISLLALLIALILVTTSCGMANTEPTPEITAKPSPTPTPVPTPTPEPTPLAGEAWLEMAEKALPAYIPIDELMDFDEYGTPQISHDGKRIFYRHTTEDEDNIEILDWETGEISMLPWPEDANGSPYFVVTPNANRVLLFIDNQGDENYGLYEVDLKRDEVETILEGGSYDCYPVAFNPKNKDEVFLAVFDFENRVYHVYSIDFRREKIKLVSANPGNIMEWVFDSKGRLAMIVTMEEDSSEHVWLKNDIDNDNEIFEDDEWTPIISWDYEDADNSGILHFDDETGNLTLLDSSLANETVVLNYNIKTTARTIINKDYDSGYDPAGIWFDEDTNEVTGVAYLRERLEWVALDDNFQQHLDTLLEVQEGDLNIFDSSADDRYWLVSYSSDVTAEDYYVYDSETQKNTHLFNANPSLAGNDYAPMEPISYEASDGLTIHGYATFPLNLERKDLPLVMRVHGGPWTRDIWGFNQEVQFLANRGYMVLQVNFRGSTGYGKDFMLAGDMEWGKKMHQDILDGIDWAVEQGWVNPDRVAIYGASYGGYEALVGAAFDSDRFACAVDCFGPSSLLTLVSSQPPQWSSYSQNMYRSIGDPSLDAVEMMERSPYYYIDDIKIPLLVVQGANDVRVTQQESDQLVNALRQAGKPVEYIFFPDTGHGFSSEDQVMTFYKSVERFLAEHLGGREGESWLD